MFGTDCDDFLFSYSWLGPVGIWRGNDFFRRVRESRSSSASSDCVGGASNQHLDGKEVVS